MAHEALKKSTANLKHIIVFSDGDPGAPTPELMQAIVGDRITVSTVLISGHAGPDTMIWIADQGKGRFYNVHLARRPAPDLHQGNRRHSEVRHLRGALQAAAARRQRTGARHRRERISRSCSATWPPRPSRAPKPRLWTDKGDPLLAHWQYGLGRAVAFTSDAKAKWAQHLAGLGQVPAVLVADRPMEPAPAGERRFHHRGHRRQGRGPDQRRSARRAGQLPQLPQPAGHRRQPQRRAPDRAPRTDRPRPLRSALPHQGSRRSTC